MEIVSICAWIVIGLLSIVFVAGCIAIAKCMKDFADDSLGR